MQEHQRSEQLNARRLAQSSSETADPHALACPPPAAGRPERALSALDPARGWGQTAWALGSVCPGTLGK